MNVFGLVIVTSLLLGNLAKADTETMTKVDIVGIGEIRGWSQSGKLSTGRGVTGRGAAVRLQAKLSRPDSLTTQFNVASGDFPFNCRATIASTVNGNVIQRIISVVDGASITTRGENITVEARDFTSPTFAGNEYVVSIVSTLGVRAANKQPPILAPLVYRHTDVGADVTITESILIPSGQDEFVPVPTDSGVISVYVTVWPEDGLTTPLPPDSVYIGHYAIGIPYALYSPISYPDWVPLSPNTSLIRLVNNHVDAVRYNVTFGIDG